MELFKIKRQIISIYIISILITLGFTFFLNFTEKMDEGGVEAATIIVDKNGHGNYASIQAAINNSKNGDTIYVWAGTYYEHVIVNKSVNIIGNGTSNTVLDGKGKDDVIFITANGVNISGFTIINEGDIGVPPDYGNGIKLYHVKYCNISNIKCLDNIAGIYLYCSSNNFIFNNNCSYNNDWGIKLVYSANNIIINNNCSNVGGYSNCGNGIGIFGFQTSYNNSNNNTLINNICNWNDGGGIHFEESSYNKVINNTCINSPFDDGMSFFHSSNNIIINNNCSNNYENGIEFWGFGGRNTVIKNTCNQNGFSGFLLNFLNNNKFINNTGINNSKYGFYLAESSIDNKFINCTTNFNSKFDLYFDPENCKNNIGINTTFNTIGFREEYGPSELIVKNFLHIQVNDSDNIPLKGADIMVFDKNIIVYATPGFGGNDPKTNSLGQIKWILVTDRVYYGNATPNENITTVIVKDRDIVFWNNPRNVNMSSSHFEYFNPNFIPGMVLLESPFNNSFINNSTPELKWNAGIDKDNDRLSYYVQIDDRQGDWKSLIIQNHTGIDRTNCNITEHLIDGTYKWRVCPYDGYQNGSWSDIWRFTIDTKAPNSTINYPINNEFYNDLHVLSGSAVDNINGSDVNKVEISIKRLDDYKYWDGMKWSSQDTWLLTTGSKEWQYNSNSVDWISNKRYFVQSRAIDKVNNTEIPSSGVLFKIDNERPISKINYPINNAYLRELKTISGNSIDIGGSGIAVVKISIQQLNDFRYWNGSEWIPKKTWLLTNGTLNWSYNAGSIIWSSGIQYKIQSQATDNVDNVEIPKNKVVFYIDTEKPLSIIYFPLNDTYLNDLSEIVGVAIDFGGSGIRNTEICIEQKDHNLFWDKNKWDINKTWLNVNGDTKWYYNTNNMNWLTDTYYTIRIRSTDNVGNTEIPGSMINFMYDNKQPEIQISINNDIEFTNLSTVLLYLQAKDSGSGISEVAYSNDSIKGSNWEIYCGLKPFNILESDGEKIIYYKVKDRANNTAIAKDIIILDTTPPYSLSINIDNDILEKNSSSIILNLNALDTLSGVSHMSFSIDGKNWSVWETFSKTKVFNLHSQNEINVIYFRVADRAGNVANPVFTRLILNTTSPDDSNPIVDRASNFFWIFNYFYLILIIIFIIISILILNFFIRRRQHPIQKENQPEKNIIKPIQNTKIISQNIQIAPSYQQTYIPPKSKVLNTDLIKPKAPMAIPVQKSKNETIIKQVHEQNQIPLTLNRPLLPPTKSNISQ